MKKLRYILGWIFVRPRRWFFGKMIWNSQLHPWFYRHLDDSIAFPNFPWWILYKTVFKFFNWLNDDAWRKFCKWEKGWLSHKPLIAKIIHRIGQTTAGERIHGMECYHCGSPDGDPVDLSQDETGKYFVGIESWSVGTMDGTDHRFSGTTICPKCGYRRYFEDGSL